MPWYGRKIILIKWNYFLHDWLSFPTRHFYIWTKEGNVFILNRSTSAWSTESCSACCCEIFVNACCCIMFSYRSLAIFSQVSWDPIPKMKKKRIPHTFKYRNSTENQLTMWEKCWQLDNYWPEFRNRDYF